MDHHVKYVLLDFIANPLLVPINVHSLAVQLDFTFLMNLCNVKFVIGLAKHALDLDLILAPPVLMAIILMNNLALNLVLKDTLLVM